MSSLAAQPQWTEQEYLEFERTSDEKHEFVDGQIIAMAGCSEEHSLICGNVIGILRNALSDSACKIHTSDMKIHIPQTTRHKYRYPDASVACESIFLDEKKDALMTPCAIFEVLSDSTEKVDRRDKFDDYRTIPSFQEYVLVRQNMMLVEHYTRQTDGTWNLHLLPSSETLRLTCAPVEIPVRDLYLKVF